MPYGAYAHNKVQLGRETTPGTAVASTVIWRGVFGNVTDARNRVVVAEDVGVLVKAERSYDTNFLARLTMPATELTFEQVLHLLEAGVQTVTPTGSGPYVYTYAMPTGNTVNTIRTYTLEAFNVIADEDFREMAYSFVEEFSFEAAAGEAWKMVATWVGRRPVTGAPTNLTTLAAVQEALLMRTTLFIDATGGTIGTTAINGLLMGASMRVRTGLVPVMVGDGNLWFASHKFVQPEITFSLTLELEETGSANRVAAERLIAEADSVRLFRLNVAGSDATRNLRMDWAGKYNLPIADYNNANGNTTVTLEGRAVYSSADSLFWSCAVTNNLAAVP